MPPRDTADVTEIGRRVFTAREALRLNQQAFADKAGLSRAYISRLERGLIPNPTITDLARVAEAADTTLFRLTVAEPAVAEIIRTRYSHDWNELQKQVEGLPPEIAEQVVRAWRESVAVIHNASALARRN